MIRYAKIAIVSLLLLSAFTLPVCATVYYADCSKADNSGNGQSWATAKKHIQACIDASSSGDEVWVKACTYNEHVTMKSGVSIYGGFAGTETERSQRNATTNETILDGTGVNNSVVTAGTGITTATVIDGFTIQNGSGYSYNGNRYGGGINCSGSGSPTISHNKIVNNTATHGGGVKCDADSTPTIEYNTIQGNDAVHYGGGINMYNGTVRHNTITLNTNTDAASGGGGIFVASYADQATISDNEITENESTTGGGIYCPNNSAVISGNTISGNSVPLDQSGGGIYCSGGTPTIEDNEITGNIAQYGGGIYTYNGSPTISGNTIDDNEAYTGAGISSYNSTVTITNNTVSNNTATNNVGGIVCAYGESQVVTGNTITGNTITSNASGANGGGMYCHTSTATISNNVVENNHAGWAGGGMVTSSLEGTVSNNVIRGNTAGYAGGGMYYSNTSPATVNNLIAGNTTTNYGGGILWAGEKSGVQGKLVNNTIAGNSGGNGGCLHLSSVSLLVENNIVAFNSYGISKNGTGTLTITNNDVYNPAGSNYNWSPAPAGDISSDPLFVGSGDYHLTEDSPCIDTGDDTQVAVGWLDIDDEPRQVDVPDVGTAGTEVDMGADEYYLSYTEDALIDRDLPTSSLNNSAGSARCNIRWGSTSADLAYGDDFAFWPGPDWQIDKVVVWVVPNAPKWPSYALGDHYSAIELYGGDTSSVTGVSVGTLSEGSSSISTSDGTTITATAVTYTGSVDYQDADGRYNQIWRIEFDVSEAEWTIVGGVTGVFIVRGVPRYDRIWFTHATAVEDAEIRVIDTTDSPIAASLTSGENWFAGKGSDINVKIYAHPVLP